MSYSFDFHQHMQMPHATETIDGSSLAAAGWPAPHEATWAAQEASTEFHPMPTTVLDPLQKQRKPPRKLDSKKCAQCRQDKVKCSPQPRVWPQKCDRCESKDFRCSPGETKRRARKAMLGTSPIPLDTGIAPQDQENQTSNVRDKVAEEFVELYDEKSEGTWDCTDLTNLVIFVQLLNHERSFLAETGSFLKNLAPSEAGLKAGLKPSSYFVNNAEELSTWLEPLIERITQVLYDRQHSKHLSAADQILCENAHEALGEKLAIPRQPAISEESLAKLPVGMRICHLIRRLKLEIESCGYFFLKPLKYMMIQLAQQWTTWHIRFGIGIGPNYVFQPEFDPFLRLYSASIGFILAQYLKQHVVCNWIRNAIERIPHDDVCFRISEFAEIWNAADDSVDISSLDQLIDVEATDYDGHSLLHAAVLCNKPRIVRALVEHNPNPDCTPTRAGFNAFHYAASIGSVDCYRELLKCDNATTLEWTPGASQGQLPLHIAARNGHKEMVDCILVSHPEDERFINAQNRFFETPLMLAAGSGSPDVVRSLLAHPGLDLTLGDREGRTALIHAGKNKEIVRLILSELPDGYFNRRRKGVTPLHLLARFAGYDLMQLVLSASSIQPDAEDKAGDTPLCEAVRHGNLEAVKALGIRRDVDVTRVSKIVVSGERFIVNTRERTQTGKNRSKILDWLKTHCKELEADLRDWRVSTSRSS